MLNYVVDFDDLCDTVAQRSLDALLHVKDSYPEFCATLFTIPARTSDNTLRVFKEHSEWLALAPHGWRHTRGECLHWPYHEAEAKILGAKHRGINAPIFRAPAWLIARPTYEVCRDNEITVADHLDEYLHVPGCRVYRYNDSAWRAPKIRPIHGHLTDCAVDNFIMNMLNDGRLTFAKKSNFMWPWQAAKLMGEKP